MTVPFIRYSQQRKPYLHILVLYLMICISLSFRSSTLQYGSRQPLETKEFASNGQKSNSPRDASTALYEQQKRKHSDDENSSTMSYMLRKHGFGERLITLANLSEMPIPCEMFANGRWRLCLLVDIKPANDAKKPPLLVIEVLHDEWETKVVDIGQVTTIWHDFHQTYSLSSSSLKEELQAAFSSAKSSLQNNILPVEKVMQNLYNNRMANRNNGGGCLTKKQIPRIAAQSSDPEHAEELLRNLVKVGEDRVSRLVDASLASDYLHTDFATGNEGIMRRILAATVLTEDAATGGRFRRRGCQFVEAHDDQQITLLNGGWIAVDASIKSGTEGRKFASLAEEAPSSTKQLKNSSTARVFTAADERIAQRLECLAMGDVWKESNLDSEQQRLELDVREALTRLNLPLSPDGAKAALIKIGRWSESDGKRNGRIEPWSSEVMGAARALALYENQRRDALAKVCFSTKNQAELEGRINLVALPCVCVDAQRATFRDDSIGLRMRSTTGRKVNKAASKWEVLIHIADVSDLYLSEEKATDGVMIPRRDGLDMEVLRGAAKRRGQSRYDLPLGPLHLLPPVALESLALSTNQDRVPNRCVTLWAYIDERDGKLLDAGVERTIISSPVTLSFTEATQLLEFKQDDVPQGFSDTKAVISVAERNLSLWSNRHKQINTPAQQRERRLATRELIAAVTNEPNSRDDGVGGFQRSRGHRLVDAALDLYAFAVSTLMKRANQPIPRAAGSGADRGGRLGTAPLRRYIDGLAQRQALSALCSYGLPLSLDECRIAAQAATEASNDITNLRSSKSQGKKVKDQRHPNQISALHKLHRHLTSTSGINGERKVKAISTGRNNEIVLEGVGATTRLKGIASLDGGKRIVVEVVKLDPEKGVLECRIA